LTIRPAQQSHNCQWNGDDPIYPELLGHDPLLLASLVIDRQGEEAHAEHSRDKRGGQKSQGHHRDGFHRSTVAPRRTADFHRGPAVALNDDIESQINFIRQPLVQRLCPSTKISQKSQPEGHFNVRAVALGSTLAGNGRLRYAPFDELRDRVASDRKDFAGVDDMPG